MKIMIVGLVLVLSSFLAVAPVTSAQVTATLTHTFPFGANTTTAAGGDTIFMSSGSGIYVLDGSSDEPTFVSTANGVINKLKVGGLVRDIDVTEDYVYVAASRKGLARYDRPTTSVLPDTVAELSGAVEAWAVTHQHVGTVDVVIAGSSSNLSPTNPGSGTIEMFWSDASNGLEPKSSVSVGAPVLTLASIIDSQEQMLRVLVGTACGGGAETAAAVQEFDIDISGGAPTTLPSQPSYGWSVMDGSEPLPTFVEDIVIDPTYGWAYVASHARGVSRLLVPGLAEPIGYGWPLACGATGCRFDGLSLIEPSSGTQLLVVAEGHPFGDGQEWGDCTFFAACDEPSHDDTPGEYGVTLYSVDSLPESVASISGVDPRIGIPAKICARAIDADEFRIDMAGIQHGMRVLKASYNSSESTWELDEVGALDQSDGNFPMANVDDVATLYNSVVAATETGVAAFNSTYATSGTQLLDQPDDYLNSGGVLLTTMESGTGPGSTGTFPAMVFSSSLTDGVRFIELTVSTGGIVTAMVDQGLLDTNGKVFGVKAIPAGDTPDGYPWLFVANYSDEAASGSCTPRVPTGAIRIYRLNKEVHGQVAPSAAVQIGAWVPLACNSSFNGKRGQLMDLWVEHDGSDDFTIWATYGDAQSGEEGYGVVAFEATWNGTSPPHGTPPVTVTYLGKEQVDDDPELSIGRIHFQPATGSLVAGFGCRGVAEFTASVGQVPDQQSTYALSGKVVLGVVNGPSGDGNVYAAFINGPIVALDPSTDPMTSVLTIVTPYQPQALTLAPSDTSGPAFYVADGSGGLHRIQLSATP